MRSPQSFSTTARDLLVPFVKMLFRTHATGVQDRAARGQRLINISQMSFGAPMLFWPVEEWRSLRTAVDGAPASVLNTVARDGRLFLANVPYRMKLKSGGAFLAQVASFLTKRTSATTPSQKT